MDYDLEKVYIDSIYKIIDLNIPTLEKLLMDLTRIGEKFETEFYMNVEYTMGQIPESLKEYCIELEI
jgi:hypothetical protein